MSGPLHAKRRITRNRAKCLGCGDVIESKHGHDWQPCKCENLFVDGGLSYLRRGVGSKGYEEMSEYADE